MSLPVILIITSQRCGHCVKMRGDGHLHSSFTGPAPSSMPGGHSYDDTFIRKLITADPTGAHKSNEQPTPKYRLYNLHLASMGGPDNEVLELLEYVVKSGGSVEERIYKKNSSSGNTDVEIYTVNPTTVPVSKLHQTTTSWADTVKTMIPSGYTSYLYFFPMVLFFTSQVWDRGLRDGAPIYGYINGMETSPTPPYGPVKSSQPNVSDPIILAASFAKGEKLLLNGPPTARDTSISATPATDSHTSHRTSEVITSGPSSYDEHRGTRGAGSERTNGRDEVRIPTGTCQELGYRLYPLQRY